MSFFSNSSLWQNTGSFMFIHSKIPINLSGKIFAFDLDGTLTTAKNGLDPKEYNKISSDNWLFLGPIKEKIESLSKDYSIFIITNQPNISKIKQDMIISVYNALEGIPTILCANMKNDYRKPNTGFIQVIRSILYNNYVDFNQGESYYCGDAVGPNDAFVPYRWGTDDSQFAYNSGLRFIRPNDLFGHSIIMPTEEMVIMMGTPGSLKTFFSKGLETYGYVRFSQDEIQGKDLQRHMNTIITTLLSGKKVVLDATFAKEEKRTFWFRIIQNINQQNGTNFKVRILWSIRNGSPWNNLRPKETKVSHFAYSGQHGYTQNFSDPYLAQSIYHYEISQLY